MKKRILSLLLALILLVSVLTVPASAATPKDVYNYLVWLAKNYGSYSSSSNDYFYAYYVTNDYTIAFGILYQNGANRVELHIFEDYTFDVTLYIPSSGATYLSGDVTYVGIGEGEFTINASTYTDTTSLTLKNYNGYAEAKSDMAVFARNYLNYILEFTYAEIIEGGYRLSDLGFKKFTKHTVHAYNNGVVTTQPTCIQTGVRTYTCKICGATATESIPTAGHKWDAGTITLQPTCESEGTKTYTCTVCGAKEREEVSPLGHAWKVDEVLEPSEETEHGTASYLCTRCGETKTAPYCAAEIFIDMPAETHFAHYPIDWAVFNGITNGMSYNTFGLNGTCTRGQVVTFLWRAAGSPEPETAESPFTDVTGGYYYKAVLWAVEHGITAGVSQTSFAPNTSCTRGQVVTFLWRAAGKPKAEIDPAEIAFADVKWNAYYYGAMCWAVAEEITKGTSQTTFGPDKPCTRAQVVTFLYRAFYLTPAPEEPPEGSDETPEIPAP